MADHRLPIVALLLALAAGPAAVAADPAKTAADTYRSAHEKQILGEFSDFLALPDVATTVPDVERNAAHLTDMLHQRGFTTQILSAGPGTPPTVYAELPRREPDARSSTMPTMTASRSARRAGSPNRLPL